MKGIMTMYKVYVVGQWKINNLVTNHLIKKQSQKDMGYKKETVYWLQKGVRILPTKRRQSSVTGVKTYGGACSDSDSDHCIKGM